MRLWDKDLIPYLQRNNLSENNLPFDYLVK